MDKWVEIGNIIKEWAAVGAVFGAFCYGLYKKIFKKKYPTIDSDVKFSLPIYIILNDLLLYILATRCFINQFHNGNEFYSGQKIQRLTISHEKCRPGVAPLKPYHDGILVPIEVHKVIETMSRTHKDWYWIANREDIRIESPELYEWMRTYDTIALLYFRLIDKRSSETIGLLGFTFNHRFRLDEDVDVLEIRKRKKEIETEFNKL
jgi:hypothetical protein